MATGHRLLPPFLREPGSPGVACLFSRQAWSMRGVMGLVVTEGKLSYDGLPYTMKPMSVLINVVKRSVPRLSPRAGGCLRFPPRVSSSVPRRCTLNTSSFKKGT